MAPPPDAVRSRPTGKHTDIAPTFRTPLTPCAHSSYRPL